MDLEFQPKFNKANRRIYSFIKRPDCSLEPQCQAILNTIERLKVCNRFELLKELATQIETKTTVSCVLSYHQRLLTRLGCIQIEEPAARRERLEAEQRLARVNIKVERNTMGGWGISVNGGPVIGHFTSLDVAIAKAEQEPF